MGFLKNTSRGREPDDESMDAAALEELYKRLYMKIGRDFVARQDFINVIHELLVAIGTIDTDNINPHQVTRALDLAQEYKELLTKGKSGNYEQLDLIILEDEDE